jgi:ABC-2 type transport system ATP-binding protein
LILDEPTAGLDPNQILEVRKLVRELGKEHTLLLSTHILSEVEAVCDRALVIARGKLVAQGTLDELRRLRHARAVSIVTRGEREAVERALRTVEGLSDLTLEAQAGELTRASFGSERDPAEITERAVAALVSAGIGVRAVEQRGKSLEEVFAEVTRTSDHDEEARD